MKLAGKAKLATVVLLTFFLTPLNVGSSVAMVAADSMVLSSVTYNQSSSETSTASSPYVELSYIGTTLQDSMSVTAYLVSAPSGSTALPYMQLIETSSARVQTTLGTDLALGSQISPNTPAYAIPMSTSSGVRARYRVFLSLNGLAGPAVNGTYVIRIFPNIPGGTPNATSQNLTLTVTGGTTLTQSVQDQSGSYPTQTILETSTFTLLPITVQFTSVNAGDSITVVSSLVSSPAGNTALPSLYLSSVTSGSASSPFGQAISAGASVSANTALVVSATGGGTVVTLNARIYLVGGANAAPTKAGTYVIRITPTLKSATGNLNTSATNYTMLVSTSPTLIATINNTPKKGLNSTFTLNASMSGVTIPGKFTIFANDKKIPSCIAKVFSSADITCNWKPAVQGGYQLRTVFTPDDSKFSATTLYSGYGVARRSNTR